MVNEYTYSNGVAKNRVLIQSLGAISYLVFSSSTVFAKHIDINQDWKFETNTNLSLGASWSMQEPSVALLYKPDANKIGKEGHSLDVNADDGRMNFSKHDAISQIIKGFTEFRLNGEQQGAVLSIKYWYDHAYETGHGNFKAFDDSAWPRLAKFKGIDLWDAYLWKNFQLNNGQTLNAKLGKHTLNWGKSQFFQNGLNSVSAFDFAAMNRPSGDIRERIIPVEMFSLVAGLNDHLKVEAFYQFKFRSSVVDGCGTFFEISDVVPSNCGPMLMAGGGDKLSDTALQAHSYIPRTEDRMPKNSGQYGIALKQVLPNLNNAELGVYYANYHNRIANFDATTIKALEAKNFNTATFFAVYPENIEIFGLSLTGKVGTTSIFSELNYKPSQPLQLNGPDVVYFQILSNETPFTPAGVAPELNQYIEGYVRLPVTQFSIGASDSISNILGAKVLLWSAEFGVNHIADIGNHRIGRSSAFSRSELSTGAYNPVTRAFKCTPYGTANLSNAEIDRMNEHFCNKDGFFSEWSLGYRVRGALNYDHVFAATVLTPSLIFRHDLHGYSQNFQQGQMAIGAALSATYQKKYSAEIAYYNYFGSNEFSVIDDRDYASLAFKVNF
ncbi:DUF1302 domain-containing protein [Acinetobacter sp. ANC 4648]|uniref:DUF1302 domain-containing protein n=1 Tax=Acinetobacter sp. ANC 4648 TaxID=1977875 RepID=UPI000A34B5D1|nr:DUF1302 domain-containing protein [Acinetobacter sp. ANC 4648]OTG83536.1 hypothetical protein B9T27_03185 [Acinetobacter sp. ANC 4648]